MIEGEKKSSAIKTNLLALSKLKGTSKHTVQDNIKSNKKVITHHPEEEMPPQQFNEHKEEDLTNANFQIKFLLSGFFENIDEVDKPSNKVDNKLKKLFDQTMNEEDVKKWAKNNSKFTNVNDNVSSIKQNQMRFQSSKVLSKLPFITEQISDKKGIGINIDKDNDISNNNVDSSSNTDKANQKKISASSRHLPNLPRLTMKNAQKKQSRFGMQSTHNLRLVSPMLTKKSDSKEQDDNTNNTNNSNTNDNTHGFETENSNKTAYHKTKQKYTSSNKVLHIKNVSTFNSSIPSSLPKPKIIITPCYNVSNEEQCNHLNFVDQFYHGESIKKATTKKSEHIKFKDPFIENDNYPLKAKTLQHRSYKGMTISSLSCGNQKQAKRLRLPSIDILDIEGLTTQNKEELNDIKNELQNHVFVNNDDSESSRVNDSKTNEQNLSSIINKTNTNTINNNNNNTNINNQSNNINSSMLLEESNQHLINNESSIITSGLPPITAHSKKISYEDEHRKLQQKGYVYDSLDDEEIEDQIDINFYLEPDALIVRVVDFVLFWSMLYSVFEIPYRLAHDLDLDCIRNGYINYYVISEIIIHFFLLIDIILSFFKAYRSFEYQIITNTNTITKEYLSSWFIIDIISAIPFYSLLRLNAPQCLCFITKYYNAGNKSVKYILIVLRLCKICKIYLNNTWYTAMRSYLVQTEHFYLWFNMYNGIIIFFMYVHSMACLFIFFAQTSHNSWIYNTNYDTAPFSKLYITAIYYVITTVTSTGYGDITITNRFEYAYNLFLLAIGVQACSYALSSFVDIINENDDKSVEYIRSCKVLEEIRLTHKMPIKLYDKVARLLKYRMIYEKKDKNIIVDSLPLRLRNTLIYEMYKPVIQNFIFFKSFDNKDFVVRVLLAFKPILASKYDVLVKEGDYIAEVIFVKTGILSLEIAIKNKEKRSRPGNTANEGYYTKAHMNTSYSHINLLPTKKTNMLMMYTRSSHGGLTHNRSQFMESKVSFNHISRNNDNDNDDDNSNNKDNDESFNDLNGKTHIKSKQEKVIVEYVKILEIRKNEHFGDILMFLDRRSPLTVRVKSNKTELFYLEKTDAVEIASTFPVVWRKIIKKSLFNMKQMERLINKAVKVCKRVYKENYQNTKGMNDFKEMKTYSISSQEEHKDSTQKMLTLIKETAPYGETSDELHSIPSSMNSVSQRSKKELTSILKHTQTQTQTQTNINNTHNSNKDDSICEEDEYPTTNASRKKLLSQGHIQSIIIEDSERGSDRPMKQVSYCKKKTSSKYNNKDSECELIDDDDNSTKHRISSKELTNNNNANNSINNNASINSNNNNINNLHIKNSIIPKHSLFNETSIKDDFDLKRTEVLSNRDLNPIIMNSFVPLTPFKYTDINNEFYPHEVNNYMNKSPPLFKRDIPEVNDITHKKGMLISLWKTPPPPKRDSIHLGYNINNNNNNNNNDDNEGTILGTCLIQSSNSNRTIKHQQQRASSFDNVSICSTTVSLNYSHSYENLNEISNYSYISSPQLQSKVKLMLQSSSSDDNNNNNKPIPLEPKETQQEEKTYHNLKGFSFYQLRSTSNILGPQHNYLNTNHEHNSTLLTGENSPDRYVKRSSKNVLNTCKTHFFEKEEQQQTSFGIGGGNTRMIHPGSKKSSILRFKGNRDLFGFTQPILPSGQISSRGRSSMIMKPNKTKKTDLLDVIGRNIETNNQILNQPEIFCADYFQKVMVNHNNKIEQQNLYKRLLNTEKILNDIDKGGTAGVGKKSVDCSPTGSKAEPSIQQGNKSECENE